MKILFFNFSLPYLLSGKAEFEGGIAVEFLNWIRAFKKLNHEVALLTWKGAKEIITIDENIEIIECYDRNKGIPKLRTIYLQIPSVIKNINKYNPDFIIQGGANLHTAIIGVSSRIANKKFIHRIASDADVDDRTNSFIRGFELFFYKRSRSLVDIFSVQNEYQLKMLKNEFPNKKIFKIYNTINIIENIKIESRAGRNYIAWVGHFRKIKNLNTLLEICLKFPKTKFKIAGIAYDDIDESTGSAIEEMKKLMNVEFVGYVNNSEIRFFLAKAICLLNTSFLEGFSNTFLESWSVGTPIVTTQKVNPDKIISRYKVGLVAENFETLPAVLNDIIKLDQNDYEHLAKSCYDYVVNNHNPITSAKDFIEKLN